MLRVLNACSSAKLQREVACTCESQTACRCLNDNSPGDLSANFGLFYNWLCLSQVILYTLSVVFSG